MKYPYLFLACAMFFGAGCSALPFASPPPISRLPAPVVPVATPPVPPEAQVNPPTTTSMQSEDTQYIQGFKVFTETRKACGLVAGHYFLSGEPGSTKLIKRAENGEFSQVVQNISTTDQYGFAPICEAPGIDSLATLILEPPAGKVIYFLTRTGKDEIIRDTFDLATHKFVNTDHDQYPGKQLAFLSDFKVSPNEDRLLYLGDTVKQNSECQKAPWIGDCTDYGKNLFTVDLASGKITNFGTLPTGYSYAREIYPPNLMGEGYRSKGDVAWIDEMTIKAVIYSDKDCMGYPEVKPCAAIKTVTVKVGQATVKP